MIKKISKFFTFFLVSACIGAVAYSNYRSSLQKVVDDPVLSMGFMKLPNFSDTVDRIKVENVLVKSVYERQELITMEVELESEVLWDDSWSADLFAKKQRITYIARGKYSTDLNTVLLGDIKFDHDEKNIEIMINKPQISSIEIDELKTVINPTENGLFRFGEAKMQAVEFNKLTLDAKNKMRDEMSGGSLMEQALSSTESSVISLYNKILTAAGYGEYTVEIIWKQG